MKIIIRNREKQRGIVLPIMGVSMLVLIALAGLALDMNHMYLMNTRLQNAADAAALSAAKYLNSLPVPPTQADEPAATAAAKITFDRHIAANGDLDPAVLTWNNSWMEYSELLGTFTPTSGGESPVYSRVTINNYNKPTWLAQVLGFGSKNVNATAVAGPSANLQCFNNVMPMSVCAQFNGTSDPLAGFQPGVEIALKSPKHQDSGIGPGNYQLIQCPGVGPGGAVLGEGMAGGCGNQLCTGENTPIITKPGNTWGKVVQGLATRFGEFKPQYPESLHPADANTCTTPLAGDASGFFSYAGSYNGQPACRGSQDKSTPPGVPERRLLFIPVLNCGAGGYTGQSSLPLETIACFFLTQQPAQGGGNDKSVLGEFIPQDQCDVTGSPGPFPTAGPFTIIQLYKNSNDRDA